MISGRKHFPRKRLSILRLLMAEKHALSSIQPELERLADDCGAAAFDQEPLDQNTRLALVRRYWACLQYHAEMEQNKASWGDTIKMVQCGAALGAEGSANGFADLALAEGLQTGQSRAASLFERDYMPLVRQVGQRVAGSRGMDLLDNFAAELIMPRKDRPPRIALYVGKTSLAKWLRSVATNYLLSKLRAGRERQNAPEPEWHDSQLAVSLDAQPCLELVRPLLSKALDGLPAEDRLLLCWLTIDGLPQQQVAKTLGIHTGNVTRRRQRAAHAVLQQVHLSASTAGKMQAVVDCLDALLTEADPTARQQLGSWLSNEIGENRETTVLP